MKDDYREGDLERDTNRVLWVFIAATVVTLIALAVEIVCCIINYGSRG